MSDLWLKIKFWTKATFFAAVVIYLGLFVFKNEGHEFVLWWWFGYIHSFDMLFLALVSFVAGGVCAVMIGTIWRTMRQIREVKASRRLGRLERENADIRTKAALLQTAPAPAQGGVTVRVDRMGESE